MGVVYKLKPEVIDYIVVQKKDIPSIGCRKLAGLASEKFDIKISKSSVSSILKDAGLSSPVGRRGSGKKPRKYRIPEQKKKKIRADLSKGSSEQPEPPPLSTKKPSVEAKPKPKSEFLSRKPAESPGEKPKPQNKREGKESFDRVLLEEAENLMDEALKSREELRNVHSGDQIPPPPSPTPSFESPAVSGSEPSKASEHTIPKGPLYDGLGALFLKAAEWDLSSRPLLGELLRNYVHVRFGGDVDRLSEVLLLMEAFGVEDPAKIDRYVGQGLWLLSGSEEPLSSKQLLSCVESVESLKNLSLKMSNERPQILSEIGYIKFELEDRTEFCLDSHLRTPWDYNVHSAISTPLRKVISLLSRKVINNVSPVVISAVSGRDSFAGPFYQVLGAFEGAAGKKILRIALCSQSHDEVASFRAVPERKRNFIIGAWPWQKEARELMQQEDSGRVRYFFDEDTETGIYYSSTQTQLSLASEPGEQHTLRVLFLRKGLKSDPVAILLSNVTGNTFTDEDIVREYILKWPNLQSGYKSFLDILDTEDPQTAVSYYHPSPTGSSMVGEGEWPSVWDNVRCLTRDLHGYCQRHFFPAKYRNLSFEEAREWLYRLPGHFRQTDRAILVTLVPEEDFPFQEDLNYAVARLNEGDVRDQKGRRLVIRAS